MTELTVVPERSRHNKRLTRGRRWGISAALNALPAGLAYIWIELGSFAAGALFLAVTALGFSGSLLLLALTAGTSRLWGKAPLIDCTLFRPPVVLAVGHVLALAIWAWTLAAHARPYAALAFGSMAVSWALIWLIPVTWKPPADDASESLR